MERERVDRFGKPMSDDEIRSVTLQKTLCIRDHPHSARAGWLESDLPTIRYQSEDKMTST